MSAALKLITHTEYLAGEEIATTKANIIGGRSMPGGWLDQSQPDCP